MCQHCFGCNPYCTERAWGRAVLIEAPVPCHACGKFNLTTNKKCKKCGADLEEHHLVEPKIIPITCLYTGMMCQNPCMLAKVNSKNSLTAQCIRSSLSRKTEED